MSDEQIRVILVDDEPLALRGLKLRLQDFPEIEIIAECANGREAVKAIKETSPDLVFLDIQMPGLDGWRRARDDRRAGAFVRLRHRL